MTPARAPRRHRSPQPDAGETRSPRPSPRPSARHVRGAEAPQLREHPAAPERVRPKLRLVDAAPPRVSLRVFGAVSCTLIFAALFGLAIFHSFLVQGQLRLDKIDRQISDEEAHQRELRLQVAQLGSPDRILAAAQARGMVQPDDRKYLAAVVPGTVVPPPTTAPAAPAKGGGK